MLITRRADMSDGVFILFILSLTLQDVCTTEFQVWTLLQNDYNDNSSVNVICKYIAPEDWTISAELYINNERKCSNDESTAVCSGRKEGNQFNFTLKITAEQNGFPCHCMVYRSTPIPVQVRVGRKVMLLPGCSIPPPIPLDHLTTKDVDVSNQSALTGYLTLVLLGIVLLLCFYSLILTVVYIRLRIKISEELQITYVPMQKRGARPKKVKGKGSDKNAEYMDMREVHQQVQPIRDVNHNSRLNPVVATV
ncbi:uncharacterized protein si:ch211-67e16.3 isoform X2 [Hemibagrus wyckioides]|uniref:uncharacterized protein si:ch211-67e16.3 isoform X2 n=1 Tax=Hemibagrus wyckioides TaxID=337641 RepID=UPI00266B9798|nr:uncharacterized protein si:ch211-67e16.3 isoform X2 [Hemibagrus wyckioides]